MSDLTTYNQWTEKVRLKMSHLNIYGKIATSGSNVMLIFGAKIQESN